MLRGRVFDPAEHLGDRSDLTTVEPAAGVVADLVHRTPAAHKSLFLATSGSEGPWVGGVYFAETGPFIPNGWLPGRELPGPRNP